MIGVMLPGLLLAGLTALLVRTRRYRSVFRIPARRNDLYVCRGTHKTFDVSAGRRGVVLPPGSLVPGHTAFLVLEVSVTPVGHYRDPFIEVVRDDVRYRQYFERGASGTRYLNLSLAFHSATDTSGQRVQLLGRHIGWKANAQLHVFEPPALEGGETLVIAPHPDDSELGAFGLYSQRLSWVVTVTCGEGSPTLISPKMPSWQSSHWLARLRVFDSLTIPGLGGVSRERRINLCYPDTRLKQMHDEPAATFYLGCEASLPRRSLRASNPRLEFRQAAAQCRWAELVDELRQTLNLVQPRILTCPHPLIDPHPDHVFTSIAVADALLAGAHTPETFLLYGIHANEVPIYPYGSADSSVSLPPWRSQEWMADGIYSHPLQEQTRRLKFFALEASHDLRSYPDAGPRNLLQLAKSLWRETSALISGMAVDPTDFLRRAPRPNEIFYVVSRDGFLELAQRARFKQRMAA
jgi:LmbE family N-acetylglucosaminyl deacetylase